ncbi:hypothetical protein WAI453_011615 [Rhynchosporium graminicola]
MINTGSEPNLAYKYLDRVLAGKRNHARFDSGSRGKQETIFRETKRSFPDDLAHETTLAQMSLTKEYPSKDQVASSASQGSSQGVVSYIFNPPRAPALAIELIVPV